MREPSGKAWAVSPECAGFKEVSVVHQGPGTERIVSTWKIADGVRYIGLDKCNFVLGSATKEGPWTDCELLGVIHDYGCCRHALIEARSCRCGCDHKGFRP